MANTKPPRNKKKLSVSWTELKSITDAVIENHHDVFERIPIEEDFYWHLEPSERYDIPNKQEPTSIGSLIEDIELLRSAVKDNACGAPIYFEKLASVFQYVADYHHGDLEKENHG